MRIKSVELVNLRAFERLKLELSPKINLLVGANNAGKSTIIYSLLNLQYQVFQKGDVRALENYARVFAEIVDIDAKNNVSFYNSQAHNEYEINDRFTTIWAHSSGRPTEENLYYSSDLDVSRGEFDRVMLKTKKGLEELKVKQFPRFPTMEDKNNFIYPFLSKRKSDYSSSTSKEETFKVSETLRNLASKIQKIDNSSHPQNEKFRKSCMDILGFHIGALPSEHGNGSIEPGIYVTDGSMIPIRFMGEGVANIVGFIILLLTEDHKLYLIEELENDIHPKALKKLLTLLAEKSTSNQFVISTHSHIVLKHLGIVPDSKIFYIDWKPINKEGKKVPTANVTEVENKPEKRIEILEKLGYDFFDFELNDSYLILEESTAEKVIRDFLIPDFVPELYNKLKTIAAKGVEDMEIRVVDFNRLFVFIHTSPAYYKKAWVIADGDEAGRQVIDKLKTTFESWPKEHFLNWKEVAFEKYYPARFQNKTSSILSMDKGPKKREAKAKLLVEVMEWTFLNREEARIEFKKSAAEIITILKSINIKLNKKTK